jgi:hypothetical protein
MATTSSAPMAVPGSAGAKPSGMGERGRRGPPPGHRVSFLLSVSVRCGGSVAFEREGKLGVRLRRLTRAASNFRARLPVGTVVP